MASYDSGGGTGRRTPKRKSTSTKRVRTVRKGRGGSSRSKVKTVRKTRKR